MDTVALLALPGISGALVSTPEARMVRALHRPSERAAFLRSQMGNADDSRLRSQTSGEEGGTVLLEALVSSFSRHR